MGGTLVLYMLSISCLYLQKTPENQTLTNISNDLPSEKLQKRHKLQIKKRLSLEKYRDPPPLLNLSNKDTGVITAQFKPPKLKR